MIKEHLTCVLAALAILAPPGQAQKLRDKDKPFNDPVQCPYTGDDPELLAKVGLVSLGPFEFATGTTRDVDEFLSSNEIYWFESAHYELGLGVGPYKVDVKERKKIRAELEALNTKLDTIPTKVNIIDPWLRGILILQRLEAFYGEFLDLVGHADGDFPDGTKAWDMTSPYMGEGPYLGQKGKYEILVLPNEGSLKAFLNREFGLVVTRSQRYNVVDRDSLIFVAHIRQGSLDEDEALHGHLVFNMTHLFLDGFKHYSYDTPVWLHEGLAHWMERGVTSRFNTFDFSEGSGFERTSKTNWKEPVRKLVLAGEASSLARLFMMRSYAEFDIDTHFVVWSMVDFLQTAHPDFVPLLIERIKGLTNEQGFAAGDKVPDAHRAAFEEGLGMNYLQFDEAWRTWVLENY